jgi:hypothetical protein
LRRILIFQRSEGEICSSLAEVKLFHTQWERAVDRHNQQQHFHSALFAVFGWAIARTMGDNPIDWSMEGGMGGLTNAAHPPVRAADAVVHIQEDDGDGDRNNNSHDSSAQIGFSQNEMFSSASYPLTGIALNAASSRLDRGFERSSVSKADWDVVAGVTLDCQLPAAPAPEADRTIPEPLLPQDVRRRWSVHPLIPSQLATDAYREAKLLAECKVRDNGKSYRSANGINAVRSRMTREIYTTLLEQRVKVKRAEVAHTEARLLTLARESESDVVKATPHDVQLSELELALASDSPAPNPKDEHEDACPSGWPFLGSASEQSLDLDASRIVFELPFDDVVGQPPGHREDTR